MKIMLFSQYFPPEIGAAPQRAYFHAKRWVERGHKVQVITNVPNSPQGKFYKDYRNRIIQHELMEGIKVIRLFTLPAGKSSTLFRRFVSMCLYGCLSLFALFFEKPDIIVGSAPYNAGMAGFFSAKFRNIPLIYEMRDPWLQIIQHSLKRTVLLPKFIKKIEKFILHHSDGVCTVSKLLAGAIREEYQLNENPFVVYNGVLKDTLLKKKASIPPEVKEITDGATIIGFVGNIGQWYDYGLLLKSALLLEKTNVQFIIVGEGSKKKQLALEIQELGLNNIHLYNAVPGTQALSIMQYCDFTIVPLKKGSLYEPCLPVRMLDSLAVGTPVIIVNGKEAPETIKKARGGYFIQHPEEVFRIINQYQTYPEKTTMNSETARKYVLRNFDRNIMADKYLEILQKTVKNRCQ